MNVTTLRSIYKRFNKFTLKRFSHLVTQMPVVMERRENTHDEITISARHTHRREIPACILLSKGNIVQYCDQLIRED